jgi:predicted ATPase
MADAGDLPGALAETDEGIACAERGSRYLLAELWRVRAEILLQEHTADGRTAAEACAQRARQIARDQGALLWELRAVLTLSRLWVGDAERGLGYRLLIEVYDRFTDASELQELAAARALLAELAPAVKC